MGYSTIEVLKEAKIATIRLNRPEKRNAVNDQMGNELIDVFADVREDSEIRSVILTGNGKGFCAGEDLSSLTDNESVYDIIQKRYRPLILAMVNLPKPIIGSINGAAAGAGMSIALACDIIIASKEATFKQAFSQIGLVPDSGNSYFFPRLVGPKIALELYLTGESISANRALEIGMINRVVEKEDLEQETHKLAAVLSNGPTLAFSATKRLVNASLHHTLSEMIDTEADLQDSMTRTNDFREGITAFLGKRPPRFLGN